ncbi:MAG: GNAT family N-acetyltransferase [Gemmatimonadetes bacterium]|jgi:GNAT superfamily N-acetyltransferase|nr:GNAT family N-acetyltransferase [Gemmatimonadota bacterium]MBT4609785.1 GNAT family N-acetyltransferase [Gemmatimonadota bacterium]MBT5057597.1 GNAT family N-acetyltransferase [Gemmatimonadota bacterium]MBT5142669.1 GNAT family N-acetyltransferase [Gemmatimonadota bacterium]MBT5587645.1 GNAT family N-acetyltransferase [Gemmatimonadota bacterium]
MIKLAESESEIAACYPPMKQLRPDIEESQFISQVLRQGEVGYRLAYLPGEDLAQCVAGFRIFEMLSRKSHMYVDDLVTLETGRSRGHGAAMIEWLAGYAKQQGCRRMDLDATVSNAAAHSFYYANGLAVISFHFSRQLS